MTRLELLEMNQVTALKAFNDIIKTDRTVPYQNMDETRNKALQAITKIEQRLEQYNARNT